jgi:hypothetical protein
MSWYEGCNHAGPSAVRAHHAGSVVPPSAINARRLGDRHAGFKATFELAGKPLPRGCVWKGDRQNSAGAQDARA